MQSKDLSESVAQLIEQSENLLTKMNQHGSVYVDSEAMAGLRLSTLSFIAMTYGSNHSYYSEYDSATVRSLESSAKKIMQFCIYSK